MTRSIVALLGLSGVGKSTVLRKLASELEFQHLQASAIIKSAREAKTSSDTLNVDELRRENIYDNQALLVDGFSAARDPLAPLIVLDGHSVIDTPQGLVRIPPEVFVELGVALFIFLADDAKAIAARRQRDKARQRPIRTPEELAQHQLDALANTFAAARVQNAPLLVLSPFHTNEVRLALISASQRNIVRC